MKIILKILFFVIFVVNYYVVSKPSGYSNTKPYSYSFSTYHNVPSTSYDYLPPSITSSGYHSKHGYDRHGGDGYDYPKSSIAFKDNLQQYPYNEYYSNYNDHDYNHQYYQPKQNLQQNNYHNSYPTAVSYQSQTIWPSKSVVHKPSYAYKTYQNSHYPSTISNEWKWKPSYGAYGSYSNNGWYDEDTNSWNSGEWIK